MNAPSPSNARRKLGRGLSGMISAPVSVPSSVSVPEATPATSPTASEPAVRDRIQDLALNSIRPNPFQPRREIADVELLQLSDSIRQSGVLQPIIVRTSSAPQSPVQFELIAGERRWRAAKLAGLAVIPAVVREASDEEAAELALVENVQREDLNAMDRAWALRQLQERFGLTAAAVGERVGLDRSSVANLTRMTELEEDVQSLIREGKLSGGHGKALLGMPPGPSRVALAKSAVAGEWSVRRTEAAAKQATLPRPAEPAAPEAAKKPPAIEDLERQLGAYLGTKVTITSRKSGAAGTVSIEYYSLDHFDGLMARIGFDAK